MNKLESSATFAKWFFSLLALLFYTVMVHDIVSYHLSSQWMTERGYHPTELINSLKACEFIYGQCEIVITMVATGA